MLLVHVYCTDTSFIRQHYDCHKNTKAHTQTHTHTHTLTHTHTHTHSHAHRHTHTHTHTHTHKHRDTHTHTHSISTSEEPQDLYGTDAVAMWQGFGRYLARLVEQLLVLTGWTKRSSGVCVISQP